MTNSVALTPEQFIFAQGEELRTTSLKVAERFGKRHDNVLRSIDSILTQVSDSFGKLNFEETQAETITPTGGVRNDRCYNLTRDGFMIVVMSFTGKPAMAIKEWYIGAFNEMHGKLFPKTQYGLKQLPPSPYISEAEAAQLKKSLSTHCQKTGVNNYPELYGKIYAYFGITSYLHIPSGKLPDAARLIGVKLVAVKKPVLPAEQLTLTFTQEQVEQQIAEAVKRVQGELVEQTGSSITIALNGETTRFIVWRTDNSASFREIDGSVLVGNVEQLTREFNKMGFALIEKSKLEEMQNQIGVFLA